MSCPLLVSSHRGQLEPTTRKPSFTSTVINTVFAWHHRPPTLWAGPKAAQCALGLLHPQVRVGAWAALVKAGGRAL